jgi:hypothetical protein
MDVSLPGDAGHRRAGGVAVMVAALIVAAGGAYAGLPDVDAWDAKRDARKYAGEAPVVAHPPCSRWCRLAGLVEARWGHKRGEDDGCFASALANVRRVGGVLEHPAYSDAWAAFDLPVPPRTGGWVRGICGGWSCHVEQGRYGHPAKKATWLYAFGIVPPTLKWGSVADISSENGFSLCGNKVKSAALMSKCRNHTGTDARPRISGKAASATPPEFRDVLLSIARSVS